MLKSPKSIPPRLKPNSFYGLYMGVKTPISLRIEFFRSLYSEVGVGIRTSEDGLVGVAESEVESGEKAVNFE